MGKPTTIVFAPCPECNGTGQLIPDCESCDGNGWVDDPSDGGTMTCPECGDEKCERCGGEKEIPV